MPRIVDIPPLTRWSWRLISGVAVVAVVALGMVAGPAEAQDRRFQHRGHSDRYHGGGRFYGGREDRYWGPPPVIYGSPYCSPPIIYGPGIALALPGAGYCE